MARRRIGQEQLAIVDSQRRGDTSLDQMSQLVDWTEIDRLLIGSGDGVRQAGVKCGVVEVAMDQAAMVAISVGTASMVGGVSSAMASVCM